MTVGFLIKFVNLMTFLILGNISCSIKKLFLKVLHYLQGTTCTGVWTPTQKFSSEYYEIFKSIYFEKYQRMAAFLD